MFVNLTRSIKNLIPENLQMSIMKVPKPNCENYWNAKDTNNQKYNQDSY